MFKTRSDRLVHGTKLRRDISSCCTLRFYTVCGMQDLNRLNQTKIHIMHCSDSLLIPTISPLAYFFQFFNRIHFCKINGFITHLQTQFFLNKIFIFAVNRTFISIFHYQAFCPKCVSVEHSTPRYTHHLNRIGPIAHVNSVAVPYQLHT